MNSKKQQLTHKIFKEVFGKNCDFYRCVETIQLSSWEDFKKIKEIFDKSKNKYIWRGQRKDWKLKSSFDRHPCYSNLTLLDEKRKIRNEILKILLKNFICSLKKLYKLKKDYSFIEKNNENYKNKLKILNKNDSKYKEKLLDLKNWYKNCIWVVGQHYFLPTPIFDWTDDPDISAYFAFYKESKSEKKQFNRIIYALNIKTLQRYLKKLEDKKQRFVEYIEPKEDNFIEPIWDRIKNQKSKFTKALNGTDIETNINKFWEYSKKHYKGYVDEVILAKILIPNKYQKKCLESLSKEITYIKLFTDYYGAVESCKINLGLK